MGCLVSWCGEPAQDHHIENGGTGRKADYTKIVPLCLMHHEQCHHIGRESFERVYGLNLADAAAQTEKRWQRFQAHTQRSEDDAA